MDPDTPISTERSQRSRTSAALVAAILALAIALISLALTVGARNRAEEAQNTANETRTYAEETVDKALKETEKSVPSGATTENNPLPAERSDVIPNGNGQ